MVLPQEKSSPQAPMRRNWFRTIWVCFANTVAGIFPAVNAQFFIRKYFSDSPFGREYDLRMALILSVWVFMLALGILLEIRLSRWASVINVGTFMAVGINYFHNLVLEEWATFDRTVIPTVHDTGVYPLNDALKALITTVVNLLFYRSVLRGWFFAPKPQC